MSEKMGLFQFDGQDFEIRIPEGQIPTQIGFNEEALITRRIRADQAYVFTRYVLEIPPKPPVTTTECVVHDTLRVSAEYATGVRGDIIIDLTRLMGCVDSAEESEPAVISGVHVVATAQSEKPVHMTTQVRNNLPAPVPAQHWSIRAQSWNPDGTPAANVRFHFIAVVRTRRGMMTERN